MQISATISVKSDDGERPDRQKLEEAAKLLAQRGFDILRIGRFGVSVRGEQNVFARVLGVAAEPNRAMAAEAKPSEPTLSDLIDRVEVATEPQTY
jgi:hypothetical protein